MSIIEIIIGYLGLVFFYYLFTFINWLNSNWENIFTKLITIIVFIGLFSIVAGATLQLRKWINAQLILQKIKNSHQTSIVAAAVKGTQYGSLLAVVLLIESAFTGYATFNTLHMVAVGNFPEALSHLEPSPLMLTIMVVQIVLVVLGAISLLQRKASAVLFLGIVLILGLTGVCYQLFLNFFYFIIALVYVTIVRGLPVAYAAFLLRNGKLS